MFCSCMYFFQMVVVINGHLRKVYTSDSIYSQSIGDEAKRVPRCLAFYSEQLGERGTEVALFDYADFSEKMLGYPNPLIIYPKNAKNKMFVVNKFISRFGNGSVKEVNTFKGVDPLLAKEGISDLYSIEDGRHV